MVTGTVNVRRFLPGLIVAAGLLAHSVAAQDEAGPPDGAIGKARAYVFLSPVQDNFLGPRQSGRGPGASFIDALSALRLNIYVDGVVSLSNSRGETGLVSATVDDLADDFVFRDAIHAGIDQLGAALDWQIVARQVFDNTYNKKRLADSLFDDGDADYVLYLEFIYFISPGLDQVRLVSWLDVHDRKSHTTLRAAYKRRVEYLSPSRGKVLRPFRSGEKESMIEAIETYYADRTERFPNNSKAYGKDRKAALQLLDKRDVIPPLLAMAEGWPKDTLKLTLQAATDRVFELLETEVRSDGRYAEFVGDPRIVPGLDMKGKTKNLKLYAAGNHGTNQLYRDKRGDLYSLPVTTP